MGHYNSGLKRKYSILSVFIPVVIYLFYLAEFKIPKQDARKSLEFKSVKTPLTTDSIFEQDAMEEFQNLPISDQRTIQSSASEFGRKKVPHH